MLKPAGGKKDEALSSGYSGKTQAILREALRKAESGTAKLPVAFPDGEDKARLARANAAAEDAMRGLVRERAELQAWAATERAQLSRNTTVSWSVALPLAAVSNAQLDRCSSPASTAHSESTLSLRMPMVSMAARVIAYSSLSLMPLSVKQSDWLVRL
jgi:hypothetical protein